MIRSSETITKLRQKEHRKSTRRHRKEHEAKKTVNFTQTYPKGWQRIRELVRTNRVLPL